MPRTRNQKLFDEIESQGIEVDHIPLERNKGITLKIGNAYSIAVDSEQEDDETFEVAVHEYAHAACGGCYIHSSPFQIKERYENRARKWAYHRYLPPSRLMDAFREGITTPWDIADRFDVTPKFVTEAVAFYRLTGEIK